MAARLPNPGQDSGVWGQVLNEYLEVSHTQDGKILPAALSAAGAYTRPVGGIPETDLESAVQTKLNSGGVPTIGDGTITKVKLSTSVQTSLDKADTALQTATKATVGLGNVDNTSDLSKPISTAVQTALSGVYTRPVSGIPETDLASAVQTKLNNGGTPTIGDGTITKSKLETAVQTSLDRADTALQTVTKASVGLSNVDNTSDLNKPISTATQTALNGVYTRPGGGIPESDLATAVQTKLNSGGTPTIGDGTITKPKLETTVQASLDKADTALQTVTKATVGLGNVDNTSDLGKPISTATQTALNGKANTSDLATFSPTLANMPAYSTFTITGTSTVARPSSRSDLTFQFITTDGIAPVNALTGDIWLNALEE